MDALSLLSQTQVAGMLGVAARTMERWRYEGRGPRFVRVGGRRLYRRADVDDFIQRGLATSTRDVHREAR